MPEITYSDRKSITYQIVPNQTAPLQTNIGSVVECLTQDRVAVALSLTSVTVLCL